MELLEIKPKYVKFRFEPMVTKVRISNNALFSQRFKAETKDQTVQHSLEEINIRPFSIFMNSLRIPNKRDHFHERTYGSSYLPMLRSSKTAKLVKEKDSAKKKNFSHTLKIIKNYVMPAAIQPRYHKSNAVIKKN